MNRVRVPDSAAMPLTAVSEREREALRLLDEVWVSVHYGRKHTSVPLGHSWPDECTDDPCPRIRAVLGLKVSR